MKISPKSYLTVTSYEVEYEDKKYLMSIDYDNIHNLTRLYLEDEDGNEINDFKLVDKFLQEIKIQSAPYTT
jgi:hypothetical protein